MRTVTFSDAKVAAALSKDFVCVWKNIRPGETFKAGVNESLDEQRASRRNVLADGTGATNICALFALPDGRILHAVQGYLKPEAFHEEIAFALQAARAARGEGAREALQALYRARVSEATARPKGVVGAALGRLAESPLPPIENLLQATTAGLR